MGWTMCGVVAVGKERVRGVRVVRRVRRVNVRGRGRCIVDVDVGG